MDEIPSPDAHAETELVEHDSPEIDFLEPDLDKTVTFKRTHLYATLLPLAFVVGLAVGYLFWGRGAAAGPATQAAAAAPDAGASLSSSPEEAVAQSTPQKVTRYDVPEDDDPSFGPQNAPITIIEFSDFECPFCTKWHQEVWPRIQEAYSDQVRLVYRDFPLISIHSNAASAAEAANCAGEQDAYWEYHDKLFSGQYGLGSDAYQRYASDMGLNKAAFEECLESRRFQDEVEADYNYARNLGISSTPTFFINGIPLIGAQPFEVFQDVIEKELAGEIP